MMEGNGNGKLSIHYLERKTGIRGRSGGVVS
jgi:hypothetical protein